MSTYLGLDAGGTRTRWVVVDGSGRPLRDGEGPPIQAASMHPGEASARLRELLVRIAAGSGETGPVAAVAGIAGAGDRATRAELERCSEAPMTLAVTGDIEVAAAAALADGPGVALWSGTGSFAVGRDAGGRLLRVGGRGPLLGDQGSGYDMVRRAASAVVLAADQLGPETALRSPLLEHFGAEEASRLGVALQRRSVSDIAAALPLVVAAAAAGDPMARAVLDRGARDLAALARAMAERLGLPASALAVTLGGGVLENAAAVADQVSRELREHGHAVQAAGHDAAHGAALLARAGHLEISPLCDWIEDGAA